MAKSLEFLELDFHDPKEVMIAISYGSVDYRDIGKRKGTFSKTIKMPSTKVNDAFFGYSFDVNNTGHFDNKIRVPIVISEIEFNGTLQLKSVEIINGNVSSYSVNIFSDIADWVTLIGEGTLRDLKHHSKHTLSKEVIIDSWVNKGSDSDYVYPLINYGNFLQDRPSGFDVNVSFWRPAFFALPLIRQTFKEAGFKFIDTGLINAGFENYILPFTSKEVKINDLKISALKNKSNDVTFTNTSKDSVVKFHTLGFLGESSDFPSESFNHTLGIFIPPSTDTYDISVDGYRFLVNSESTRIVGGSDGRKNGDMRIVFGRVDGTGEKIELTPPGDYFENKGKSSTQVILKGAASPQLQKGIPYRIFLQIDMLKRSDVTVDMRNSTGGIDSTIEITPRLSSLVTGSVIDHSLFVQNIKKIDLLSDIINQGNFRILTDNRAKTVEFIRRDEFLQQNTEDWSSKLDQSRPSTITHIQNEGAKELTWEYSNDSEDGFVSDTSERLDVNWGTKKVVLDSEYRKGVSNVYTSVFSSTLDGSSMSLKMPVMSTQKIIQGEPILRGSFETSFENRCLIYGGLRSGSVTVDGLFNSQYPYCFFVDSNFSLQWDSLSDFYDGATDTGLIDRNYSTSIRQLNNSKLLTAWFNLNELDISNLNFRTAKSINGTHYYLNKVTDYLVNNNQPTKVELISR
jgi:hypothetical protein